MIWRKVGIFFSNLLCNNTFCCHDSRIVRTHLNGSLEGVGPGRPYIVQCIIQKCWSQQPMIIIVELSLFCMVIKPHWWIINGNVIIMVQFLNHKDSHCMQWQSLVNMHAYNHSMKIISGFCEAKKNWLWKVTKIFMRLYNYYFDISKHV